MLEDTDHKNDFESDKKLREYYRSCTNKTLREEIGVSPLYKMLKRKALFVPKKSFHLQSKLYNKQ